MSSIHSGTWSTLADSVTEYSYAILVALFSLVVWQFYGMVTPAYILSPPTDVLALLVERRWWFAENLATTAVEIILGLLLGLAIGILLSFGIYISKYVKFMLWPFVLVLQLTPKSALLPVLIIYLGIGMTHKIVTSALAVIFVVAINMIEGFERTDRKYRPLARSMNVSGWTYFRKFILPSSVASIFSGVYVSLSIAAGVVIVGEWIASRHGLGRVMALGLSQGQSDLIFTALIVVMAFSLTLFWLLYFIEITAFPWAQEVRDRGR